MARAEAHPRLIPNLPMDIPRIRMADFHIAYRGQRIIGRWVPFDSLATRLDIENGRIRLTGFRMAVGRGAIAGTIDMTPTDQAGQGGTNGGGMRTRVELQLQRLDVRRLLAAAGNIFQGNGLIGGRIEIDSVGRSLAEVLPGTALGGSPSSWPAAPSASWRSTSPACSWATRCFPPSACRNALPVRCLIGDLALTRGALRHPHPAARHRRRPHHRAGSVDLGTEAVSAVLRTRSKHFTIGTLATPIWSPAR